MAKNTSSSAFRKIDIDQYNEDNFKEDEAEQSMPTGPEEGEVCAMLNQGRFIDALHLVLNSAPMGSSNQQVKKLIILLCCTYYSYASHHHSHTIPVEGYESKLENLGQHVDLHETPVKVIKITKTVAVKVPVPYPVKIIQKVPYPVHVSKPYPVPVPQIVHVPAPTHKHGSHDVSSQGNAHDSPYQVHEGQDATDGHSFGSLNDHSVGGGNSEHSFGGGIAEHSFGGGNSGHNQNIESFADEYPSSEGSLKGSSYDAPSHTYYGNTGNHEGSNSIESKNYDQAIQEYLQKVNAAGGSHGAGAAGHYH